VKLNISQVQKGAQESEGTVSWGEIGETTALSGGSCRISELIFGEKGIRRSGGEDGKFTVRADSLDDVGGMKSGSWDIHADERSLECRRQKFQSCNGSFEFAKNKKTDRAKTTPRACVCWANAQEGGGNPGGGKR